MQDRKGKRTVRMTFTEAEYKSLSEMSGRYGFAYPAKFVKASVRIIMERLENVEYVYGPAPTDHEEIRDVFKDYSDWQRTSDHAFGSDIRQRR